MKIIDFEKQGNLVRFYLGNDECKDYWGDDWNDSPYDCNAGEVYDEYIVGYVDVVFPYDYAVAEPCEFTGRYHTNCRWCKEDMKKRKVPCIVARHIGEDEYRWEYEEAFDRIIMDDNCIKFYFEDRIPEEMSTKLVVCENSSGQIELLPIKWKIISEIT